MSLRTERAKSISSEPGAVDRVYGISELGWEDEPLILAIAENGKYVLEVKSSDISVRARILWDDKVILERKWSVKLLR